MTLRSPKIGAEGRTTSRVDQQAENGGRNVFAQRDVVIHGVSASDVVAICEQVWKANFPTYVEAARLEAERRVEEFGRKLFAAFARNGGPESIKNFTDPGLQASLLDAMRGVARSGDTNLSEILADLLVQRTKQPKRNIMQLSLDEALLTAAKLTNKHYNALTFLFFIVRAKFGSFDTVEGLYRTLQQNLIPFSADPKVGESDVQYLQATGCGSVNHVMSMPSFSGALKISYPGLFATGILPEEAKRYPRLQEASSGGISPLVPCSRNPELLQVNALDKSELEVLIDSMSDEAGIDFIRTQFEVGPRLGDVEIVRELEAFDSRFSAVIRNWDQGNLRNFHLTVTGIVIAHANACRVLGNLSAGLEIWIH